MEFLEPKKALSSLSVFHGATVADFGAGSGDFAVASANLAGPTGKVYALDIRSEILSRVKSNAAEAGVEVEILTADLEKRGGSHLADSSCDFVIVTNILFQVEKKDIFLEEIVRVLKSGGKVLLVDWSESHGGLGPKPDMIVSKEKAQDLAHNAGLKTLSEVSGGAYHYGYILEKP